MKVLNYNSNEYYSIINNLFNELIIVVSLYNMFFLILSEILISSEKYTINEKSIS